ncbi:hypothetical protein NAL12_01380, partial [Corynebacterium belfantii]|uniref:hypothetical protein n=1 Tax=Corynebacterium belfantii TaxID=2014537 RepID=UPI003977E324
SRKLDQKFINALVTVTDAQRLLDRAKAVLSKAHQDAAIAVIEDISNGSDIKSCSRSWKRL